MHLHLTLNVDDVPSRPGVYAIFKGDDLLYIGTSANLKSRLLNHRGSPLYNHGRADTARWIVCDSTDARLAMEKWLIMKHKPKQNRLFAGRGYERNKN